VKRLKELEVENTRLRKAVSDLTLDNLIVNRLRTVDQDRRRRGDHPLGCEVATPRLEARSAA
jgi:hypothetical protein